MRSPLATTHSSVKASRYNDGTGRYEIFYTSEDQVLALLEVGAVFCSGGSFMPNVKSARAWTVIPLDVRLHEVVDLLDPKNQNLLKITDQMLTGSWNNYRVGSVPTQQLAAALFNVPGLEAFIVPSAKISGRNLVIFPEKLHGTSHVTFTRPPGRPYRLGTI
jgi:hypothetical protein